MVLSDRIVVEITSEPGETFIDRMITLVEGAERQKTPNEIALDILLAGLTIVFLLATVTLKPFALYSRQRRQSVTVLIALLVCLIPTTIGALLSAIGIAGMDRVLQHNILAMSGRAVEAAGDVERAAARQDRHDHARQPAGHRVRPAPGVDAQTLADVAQLSSLADETPEGRSIVVLAKEQFGICAAASCTTLGAHVRSVHREDAHVAASISRADARCAKARPMPIARVRRANRRHVPRPGAAGRRAASPARAARRSSSPTNARVLGIDLSQGHRQRRDAASASTACA